LKLRYDEALSNSAFNFNLRRYTMARKKSDYQMALEAQIQEKQDRKDREKRDKQGRDQREAGPGRHCTPRHQGVFTVSLRGVSGVFIG
jgi:hypothetical protein